MVIRSRKNSIWMRLSCIPSPPSTPSAPPKASATIGIVVPSTSNSPNSSVSAFTAATIAEPVTPRSFTAFGRSGIPTSSTTRWITAERVAPVSSTSR
jgi:hypothetical protein